VEDASSYCTMMLCVMRMSQAVLKRTTLYESIDLRAQTQQQESADHTTVQHHVDCLLLPSFSEVALVSGMRQEQAEESLWKYLQLGELARIIVLL
jgi:hypothetical protein